MNFYFVISFLIVLNVVNDDKVITKQKRGIFHYLLHYS